jgi:hypothetical protein
MTRITRAITVAGVLVATALTGSLFRQVHAAEPDADPWQALRPLAGTWKGEGEGFGAISDVTHEWEFVIQDKFLRLRTRSVQRGESGPGDVHEDIGIMSWDTGAERFVFRQFLSEGFVNTFDLVVRTGDKLTITFEPREAESTSGMRARMEMVFETGDLYEMTLELASPGKDFAACQQMRLKRTPR